MPKNTPLEENQAITLKLSNDGKHGLDGNEFTAIIAKSGDAGVYDEVTIDIQDKDGNIVTSAVLGLNPDRLTPQISLTADGDGHGDLEITVDPMVDAFDAVTIHKDNYKERM